MDIVYLLGKGSNWNNNEIKYSLRSVEKHLSGVGKVFCVGTLPEFLKDVTLIECEDLPHPNMNKAATIRNKILAAAESELVSDPFMVFSDDYFLLKDYECTSYPFFQRGTLEEGARTKGISSLYRQVYGNTMKVLKENNLPQKHFNVHAPIFYDKKKVKEAFALADWNTMLGFMSKSLYCNYMKMDGVIQLDCKIGDRLSKPEIYQRLKDAPFFTISDRGLFRGKDVHLPMLEVLEELYPNKSKWEI